MTLAQLQSGMESVIFAAGDGISAVRLAEVFEIGKEEAIKILQQIKDRHLSAQSGIELVCTNGNYQFVTKLVSAPSIKKALDMKRNTPLSAAALEVLAVIAYNQPVTKSFVEQVRGVDSSGVIGTLIEKDLIEEAARLDLPGRPISYKVTDHFLRCFCMEDLSQLPPLPRDGDITGDADEAVPLGVPEDGIEIVVRQPASLQ